MRQKRKVGTGLVAGVILGLSGCGARNSSDTEKQPPKISVSYPIQRQVTDYAEYTGRTASPDSVQIRARVSGYLEKIAFTEGLEVKEDAVLYEIDRRPYKAALDQAKAQVELQTAQLIFQEAVYERSFAMFQKNAQAPQQMQQDRAARDTARANLAAAKANLVTADLNYGWTLVKAPISGRIGRTIVTRGNLVIADQTLLTTLVAQEPMWAYFDVDEPTVLKVQELIRQGKLASARSAKIPVFLRLDSEEGWPHEGTVDFVNNQFDPSTATLKIRGVFKNPKPSYSDVRVLSPGQFVRIRIAVSPRYDGLLVNAAAIGTDQHLNYVYVVDEQNKIARHDVELGTQQGGLQVIRKGLQAGEKVVVKEVQRVHQGMTVNPHLVEMPVPQGQESRVRRRESGAKIKTRPTGQSKGSKVGRRTDPIKGDCQRRLQLGGCPLAAGALLVLNPQRQGVDLTHTARPSRACPPYFVQDRAHGTNLWHGSKRSVFGSQRGPPTLPHPHGLGGLGGELDSPPSIDANRACGLPRSPPNWR